MSGQMMNYNTYKNRKKVDAYITVFNPYESKPSIGIDLVAVSRYAKEIGKKLDELTVQELVLFKSCVKKKKSRY